MNNFDGEYELGMRRIAESDARKAAKLVPVSVWRVDCVEGDAEVVVHLFSSQAKATAFCDSDHRSHVISEQIIDAPEAHERRRQ